MKIRNKNLLAHQANAYPYLLCVMTAQSCLLPPGWDSRLWSIAGLFPSIKLACEQVHGGASAEQTFGAKTRAIGACTHSPQSPMTVLVVCPLKSIKIAEAKSMGILAASAVDTSISEEEFRAAILKFYHRFCSYANTRGSVSKISVSLACYRQIGSKSTIHSLLA